VSLRFYQKRKEQNEFICDNCLKPQKDHANLKDLSCQEGGLITGKFYSSEYDVMMKIFKALSLIEQLKEISP